jgi:hypothetical protein
MTADTYHIQYEVSIRPEAIFAYDVVAETEYQERRNVGDVTFCTQCEDLYNHSFDETLCFKCRGYKYDASQNIEVRV